MTSVNLACHRRHQGVADDQGFRISEAKPGLSPQDFAEYYEHNHVPLVLSKAFMPMVYKRNYIQRGDAFNIEGEEIGFDCMTDSSSPNETICSPG